MAALEVVRKEVPAVRVVSLRKKIFTYSAQLPLWTRLSRVASAHGLRASGAPCLAVFYDPEYKLLNVDVEVAIPITHEVDAEAIERALEGCRVYELPALGKCASVRHTGPYRKLLGIYKELFAWLQEHGEEVAGPIREVYHVMPESSKKIKENDYVTEILVPLK